MSKMFKPSGNFLAGRSKAALPLASFVDHFCYLCSVCVCHTVLSVPCSACGHLLGMG